MFKTFTLRLKKKLNWKRVNLSGLKICSDRRYLPYSVRYDLYRGSYEIAERELVEMVVRPGMSVVEIGAGIGVVGLLAKRLSQHGPVWTYEANTNLEPIIRLNYTLNPLNPELIMHAVTLDGGPVSFYSNEDIVSSSLLEVDPKLAQQIVQSVAFKTILSEKTPDLVIMDVEGAEIELLTKSDLSSLNNLIVEFHPSISGIFTIKSTTSYLENLGFKMIAKRKDTIFFQRIQS